jgi:deoxyribonuclease-4
MKILGRHLNICNVKELRESLIRYLEIYSFSGFTPALQIFIGDSIKPDNKNIYNIISTKDIIKIREIVKKSGVHIGVHSNYLTQLTQNPQKNMRTLSILFQEIKSAMAIGAKYIIVHCGSKRKKEGILRKSEALKNIAESYVSVIHRFSKFLLANWKKPNLIVVLNKNGIVLPRLLLEISAGAGGEMGKKVKDFQRIFSTVWKLIDKINKQERELVLQMVGVCVDTCHLFASGVDVRNSKILLKYLSDLNAGISPNGKDNNFIRFIHFNDAGYHLGSHMDVHDTIGCGYIGDEKKKGDISGFMTICKYAEKRDIPLVLETAERECMILKTLDNEDRSKGASEAFRELRFVTTLFNDEKPNLSQIDYCE